MLFRIINASAHQPVVDRRLHLFQILKTGFSAQPYHVRAKQQYSLLAVKMNENVQESGKPAIHQLRAGK